MRLDLNLIVKRCVALCVAVLASATPAAAQDRPFSFAAGGAVVGPLSGSADRFSTGFGFTGGATWHINGQLGVTADYLWSALGARSDWPTVPLSQPVEVTPRLQFGTVNVRFQAPPGRVRPYVLAGLGLYHRSVALSTSGASNVAVCDPWWLVCHPGGIAASGLNGTRSTTDPGVGVGAGLTAGRFFVEIRYHYMWGPTFDAPGGRQKATGKFLPLTVGVVF